MDKTYSIEDLAGFTGLTDRTLRSYLQEGRLTGAKVDGAWRFSPEDVQRLFLDGGARRAMEANRNAKVYDFMLGGQPEDRCCRRCPAASPSRCRWPHSRGSRSWP